MCVECVRKQLDKYLVNSTILSDRVIDAMAWCTIHALPNDAADFLSVLAGLNFDEFGQVQCCECDTGLGFGGRYGIKCRCGNIQRNRCTEFALYMPGGSLYGKKEPVASKVIRKEERTHNTSKVRKSRTVVGYKRRK